MNNDDVEVLKSRIDQSVKISCKDGEVLVGRVHFVSEEEQDVIYDLLSSTRMDRYKSFGDSAFRLTFDEIDFVTLPES